jgi:hypothetical protein
MHESDPAHLGRDLGQQLEALAAEDRREEIDAGQVASRPVEARDQAETHRIGADREDDRDLARRPPSAARAEAMSPVAAIASTFIAASSAASAGRRV